MKYDLIIVGGGPSGLMAAKIAAEDGLKVLLIDKKKEITKISRGCASIFYTCKMSACYDDESGIGAHLDAYLEPVSVECTSELNKTRFHFKGPGFYLDYEGDLRPYLNWVQVSPGGHRVYRYQPNRWPWGFYFDKEVFVTSLLIAANKAGAEIRPATMGLAAENFDGGVRVQLKDKTGTQSVEARAVIAADGLESRILDSVGLNKDRKVGSYLGVTYVQYIMEGVDTDFPPDSWVSLTIPSINTATTLMIGMWKDGTNLVGTVGRGDIPATSILDKFISDPRYAHWFSKAKVIKKMGTPTLQVLTPVKYPIVGNVVLVGDAGLGESWVQGAVVQAYHAVKAIENELNGQSGYSEYAAWRQKAYAVFSVPTFWSAQHKISYNWIKHATDGDVDYVFKQFKGRIGFPPIMLARDIKVIEQGRPKLYDKLVKNGLVSES